MVECTGSSDTGEIVCILDALDECEESGREQLIYKLKDFYCQSDELSQSPKLKFLITSRPYPELEAAFKKFSGTAAYLRLDGDDKSEQVSREINLVIDAKVADIAADFKPVDQQRIAERLKSMEAAI